MGAEILEQSNNEENQNTEVALSTEEQTARIIAEMNAIEESGFSSQKKELNAIVQKNQEEKQEVQEVMYELNDSCS